MMDNKYTTYTNPLTDRYCSKDMSYIFSPQFKFSTWRKLWVALAEGEKELGINITEEQLDELRNNIDNINFDEARKIEKEVKSGKPGQSGWRQWLLYWCACLESVCGQKQAELIS